MGVLALSMFLLASSVLPANLSTFLLGVINFSTPFIVTKASDIL